MQAWVRPGQQASSRAVDMGQDWGAGAGARPAQEVSQGSHMAFMPWVLRHTAVVHAAMLGRALLCAAEPAQALTPFAHLSQGLPKSIDGPQQPVCRLG
jgi:hypothetical protein